MSKSILITYFSRKGKNYIGGSIVDLPVGNTEVAAKIIEKMTGGELFMIDPVNKYALDYITCTDEAKDELQRNARPELNVYPESLDDYGTIILGYPNWWVRCQCRCGHSSKSMTFPARPSFLYVPMRAAAWGVARAILKSCVQARRWRKDLRFAAAV